MITNFYLAVLLLCYEGKDVRPERDISNLTRHLITEK